MFEFLTSVFDSPAAAAQMPAFMPDANVPGAGLPPYAVLPPEAMPPRPPSAPPAAPPPTDIEIDNQQAAAPTNDEAEAAESDVGSTLEQRTAALELARKLQAETSASGIFSGPDKDKVAALLKDSPESLEAMRTAYPELYRKTRGMLLTTLDEDDREQFRDMMPRADMDALTRERAADGKLTAEMNEDVKKITPERRQELEQAVAEIQGSQGIVSNDVAAVRTALAGKSPAEIEAMRRLWLHKFPDSVLDMDEFLGSNFKGSDGTEVAGLLSGDEAKAAAGTIFNTLNGVNDSATALETLKKIKDPEQRKKVAEEFKKHWVGTLKTSERMAAQDVDPMKYLEDTMASQLDGVVFDQNADSKIARHLVHGDYGKAAAEKLLDSNGIINDSEEEGWAALGELSDPKLLEEARAELIKRGTTLGEQLDHYDGDEKVVAEAKLDGDKALERAARLKLAADGAGTGEKVFNETYAGLSDKERAAVDAAWDTRFGKKSGRPDAQSIEELAGDELDDADRKRFLAERKDGQMAAMDALKYATDGVGTNDKMAKDALKRLDPAERKQLLQDDKFLKDMWNLSEKELERVKKDPTALTGILTRERNVLDSLDAQEVSGRDGFEMAQLLLGKDYNQDGKEDATDLILRAKDKYDFARGAGAGPLAKMADAATVNESEKNLDATMAHIRELEAKNNRGEMTAADEATLKTLTGYQDQDIKTTLAQRDQFAEVAAGVTAATLATAVTIITAGGGGPAAIAAWKVAMASAAISGTAGLAVKRGIQGNNMSNETMATEMAMIVAQTASGGLMASDKAGAVFAKLGTQFGKLSSSPAGKALLEEIGKSAAKGAANAAGPAMLQAFTNEDMWKGDGEGRAALAKILLTQIGSGAISGGVTGGLQGKIDNKLLAGFLGGTVGASATELINNNEAIAQAVREGRLTPETLQSLVNVAQSAADSMSEQAPDGPDAKPGHAKTEAGEHPASAKPAHGESDAPAPSAKPAAAEEHAPVRAPEDQQPADAPRYGEQADAAKRKEWDKAMADPWASPEELKALDRWAEEYRKQHPEADVEEPKPVAEKQPEEKKAKPIEEPGDRLEDEGQWSDDPDPHGVVAKAAEEAAKKKAAAEGPPAEDVEAAPNPVAAEKQPDEPAAAKKADEPAAAPPAAEPEKPLADRVQDRLADLEQRRAAGGADEARLDRERGLVDAVKNISDPALAEAALKVAGRESDHEMAAANLQTLMEGAGTPEGAAALRDALARLEIARKQDVRAADPAAVASAKQKLADGAPLTSDEKTALLRDSVDAARKGLMAEAVDYGLDPNGALRAEDLGGNCGWSQGRVANSLEKAFGPESGAQVIRHATHGGDADVAGPSKLTGDSNHYFTVVKMPDGQSYIVDPTFGQFMQADGHAGQVGTRLMNADGGAEMAGALVKDGFIPLTPEVAQAYGAAMSGKDGSYTVDDFMEGNARSDYRERARKADEKQAGRGNMATAEAAYADATRRPSPLAPQGGDASARPLLDGMEKSLATTTAGEGVLGQLARKADDGQPMQVTTERGKGNFRDGNVINIDPELVGDNPRKMAGVLAEQMAVHTDIQGETPEARRQAATQNAAEARAARIEHHLEDGFGPDASLRGAREYDGAYNDALAAGKSPEEARAAGVKAIADVLTPADVTEINPAMKGKLGEELTTGAGKVNVPQTPEEQALASKYNPTESDANCGYTALARIREQLGIGELQNAEQLRETMRQKLGLPPDAKLPENLIVPGSFDPANPPAMGNQFKDLGERGMGPADYTLSKVADDLGVDLQRRTGVVADAQELAKRAENPELADQHAQELIDKRTKGYQKNFGADAEVPPSLLEKWRKESAAMGQGAVGEYVVWGGAGGAGHYITMTVGPDGTMVGLDPQSGKSYKGWDAIQGFMGEKNLQMWKAEAKVEE